MWSRAIAFSMATSESAGKAPTTRHHADTVSVTGKGLCPPPTRLTGGDLVAQAAAAAVDHDAHLPVPSPATSRHRP